MNELKLGKKQSHLKSEKLSIATDAHTGLEILHLFIKDLLGRDTPTAIFFETKAGSVLYQRLFRVLLDSNRLPQRRGLAADASSLCGFFLRMLQYMGTAPFLAHKVFIRSLQPFVFSGLLLLLLLIITNVIYIAVAVFSLCAVLAYNLYRRYQEKNL